MRVSKFIEKMTNHFETNLNTRIAVTFVPSEEVGYGETNDNFNIYNTNNVRIFCGNEINLRCINEDLDLPEDVAIKIIQSLAHEFRHIEQRLALIKKDSRLSEILSLEYLCCRNGNWYKNNYLKTVLEADAQLYSYIFLFAALDMLNVDNNTQRIALDIFEKSYKKIIPDNKLNIIKEFSDVTNAKNYCIELLLELKKENLDQMRGIFKKIDYTQYLRSKCKSFIEKAPQPIRRSEDIRNLLSLSPSLSDFKMRNDEIIAKFDNKIKRNEDRSNGLR